MKTKILHSRPWITDLDMQSVARVLKGEMIAKGEVTKAFEKELCRWMDARWGVTVGSGSGALVLALKALDVEPFDEIIMPSYVCPSVLNAVTSSGAVPVLCDVGDEWVVTETCIRSVLTSRSKAIIVPHIYGIYADIKSIKNIGLPIIEDSSQAFGKRVKEKSVGDITIASFHPTKCLTTGEGGGLLTSNPIFFEKIRELLGQKERGSCHFLSPMSDMNAALGLSQLQRYDTFLERRANIAAQYIALFKNHFPDYPPPQTIANSMFFRFPIRMKKDFETLRKLFDLNGVCIRKGVDQLLHRMMGLPDGGFKTSVDLFNTTLSFPIYPALTRQELETCKSTIKKVFSQLKI